VLPHVVALKATSYENALKNTGKMPALRAFSCFVVAFSAMQLGVNRQPTNHQALITERTEGGRNVADCGLAPHLIRFVRGLENPQDADDGSGLFF